jgi:hypothetical protein
VAEKRFPRQGVEITLRQHDKNKALEMLCKIRGLFAEGRPQDGAASPPLVITILGRVIHDYIPREHWREATDKLRLALGDGHAPTEPR